MRPGLPATGILAAVALLVLSIASYVSISAAFLSGAGGFQRLPKSSGCSSHPRTLTPTRASSRPSPCFFMLNSGDENLELGVARTLATLLAGVTVMLSSGGAVLADGSTQKFSLPPISTSKDRCVFKSSAMGQANAARDKLYDLRQCDLRLGIVLSQCVIFYGRLFSDIEVLPKRNTGDTIVAVSRGLISA